MRSLWCWRGIDKSAVVVVVVVVDEVGSTKQPAAGRSLGCCKVHVRHPRRPSTNLTDEPGVPNKFNKHFRFSRSSTASHHVRSTINLDIKRIVADMSATLPFRDINVHASSTYYAFSSPSSPDAPTLVIDRPSGDLRLNDGKLTGGNRVSSISGILGIIKLRLGMPPVPQCRKSSER